VTREPIPRIRPAVGEYVAAITAACVVPTGGATGRAAAAIGHRSASQCPNPCQETAICGHPRSGGRSSEPAELQGLRLCQRDSGPRLKIVVSPVKARVSLGRRLASLGLKRLMRSEAGDGRVSESRTRQQDCEAPLRPRPRRLPLIVQLSSSRASMAAPPHCRVRCELRYPALSPVAFAVR